jgi:DNA-damage-inducible protein J
MTKTATVQFRINQNTKDEVEKVVQSLGITLSEAVSMYFEQIKSTKSIPLTLDLNHSILLTEKEEEEVQKSLASGWAKNESIANLLKD